MKDKIYNYHVNKAVLKLIPDNAMHILDIGCGNGGIREYVNKSTKIDGITISQEEYNICLSKLDNVYLHNLENGLPSLNKHYDVIIASHIIEHIAYPERLLNDIKNIMKDADILIVALPNVMHYKSRIQILKGNFNYENTGVMDYTHLRWYTFNSAQKLFTDNNFRCISASVDSITPFYKITKYLPIKIQQLIKKITFGISKGLFGMQILMKLAVKDKSPMIFDN